VKGRLNDSIGWSAAITPHKMRNAWRVWRSFRKSRSNGYPVMEGLPIGMSFEPTTACNLRCPECPSGLRSFTRPTGNLKQDLFKQVIDQVYRELVFLTFYFQGEPFINPDFLRMVEYAHNKGIYTATSTNAHFITPEVAERTVRSGLSRLIISIDGTDQKTYSSYRQEGELQKVLDGARNIVEWKRRLNSRTPHVIFQFLVVKPNEHQISEVRQLATDVGVDELRLKSAQVYEPRDNHPLIPTIDKYSRYERTAQGEWRVKNALSDECWKMWHSCVVTWDGKVVPCCFDKDAQHVMGSLRSDSFQSLWNSKLYNDFRGQLLSDRTQVEMCRNCSEGSPVWV
jgi:radical SAM protein with 4Fe4S-binding SPASM domain